MLNHKKIAIIGISGSGKSTLARFLARNTSLPVVHLDTVLWRGKWEEVPKEEYLIEHQKAISGGEWIIEGCVDRQMADRLRYADLVLYLDYSGIQCFLRVIRRWWMHRKTSRPELPSEAVDRFDPGVFLKTLVRAQRKHVEEAIVDGEPVRIIIFRTPKELDRFITDEFQEAPAFEWTSGRFLKRNNDITEAAG